MQTAERERPTETIAFRVRPQMLAELRALAEEQETSVGTLLRKALRLLLAEERDGTEQAE